MYGCWWFSWETAYNYVHCYAVTWFNYEVFMHSERCLIKKIPSSIWQSSDNEYRWQSSDNEYRWQSSDNEYRLQSSDNEIDDRVQTMNIDDRVQTMNINDRVQTMNIDSRVQTMNIYDRVQTMNIDSRVQTMNIYDRVQTMNIYDRVQTMNIDDRVQLFIVTRTVSCQCQLLLFYDYLWFICVTSHHTNLWFVLQGLSVLPVYLYLLGRRECPTFRLHILQALPKLATSKVWTNLNKDILAVVFLIVLIALFSNIWVIQSLFLINQTITTPDFFLK